MKETRPRPSNIKLRRECRQANADIYIYTSLFSLFSLSVYHFLSRSPSIYLSVYLSILSIPLSLPDWVSWWHAIVFWLVCRLSKGDRPPGAERPFEREREYNPLSFDARERGGWSSPVQYRVATFLLAWYSSQTYTYVHVHTSIHTHTQDTRFLAFEIEQQ